MSEENTLDDFLGDEKKDGSDKPIEPKEEADSIELLLAVLRDFPGPFSIDTAKDQLSKISDTAAKIYFLETALMNLRLEYVEMDFNPDEWMNPEFLRKAKENQEFPIRTSSVNFPIWCNQKIEILKKELEFEAQNPPKERHELNYPDFTNSQYVLMFYYLIKYAGIEPRDKGMDIAPFAKFIHIITGKNFTTIQNSDFYKKLSKAPIVNKDKQLIKDLEVIKAQFERVDLKEIIISIDNDLDEARTEIKYKNKEK